MTGHRPRTSTLVLVVLFLAVAALYVWVRPDTPATTGSVAPASTSSSTPPASTTESPTPSASPSPTHSHSTSPQLSATPPPSPSAATTAPTVGGTGPSAASP